MKLNINFPESINYSMSQAVRIQDVNYRKHLGHDKLVSMIHEARAAFFESLGISELVDSSEGYILADLQVMYLDEAFFGDELKFEIALSEVSNRSCQICYRISKGSKQLDKAVVIAKAKTGVVFYDYDLRQAISAPPELSRLKMTNELK